MKTTKKAIQQAIRDGKATDISRYTEKQLETLALFSSAGKWN